MKQRLDQYLTANGFAESREKAQAIIMAGNVYVNNQKSEKSGLFLKESDVVEVRDNSIGYVSRGGLKLEKAIKEFGIDLAGKTCMDIGASTGGFTDCMLQNGAARVTCVDVGYGQLAWKLREDKRVTNLERTNIRYIDVGSFEKCDFISVDVSFISLKLVLPVVRELLADDGECIALIKPQFEAGRESVGKNGIVKDRAVHIAVIEGICGFARELEMGVKGLTFSPVRGAKGNIEYLAYLGKMGEDIEIDIKGVVDDANEN